MMPLAVRITSLGKSCSQRRASTLAGVVAPAHRQLAQCQLDQLLHAVGDGRVFDVDVDRLARRVCRQMPSRLSCSQRATWASVDRCWVHLGIPTTWPLLLNVLGVLPLSFIFDAALITAVGSLTTGSRSASRPCACHASQSDGWRPKRVPSTPHGREDVASSRYGPGASCDRRAATQL